MKAEKLIEIIGAGFYTGVPDSLLRALCDCLEDSFGSDPERHIIAANEGNCAALAAGFYLSSGRVPVVYMQNSGEGNIINPAASLLNEKVYAIPVLFIIGWRGEEGVRDEPQHVFQGEITLKLLEDTGIEYFVIGKDTTDEAVSGAMERFRSAFASGRSAAFVVRKGALTYEKKIRYANGYAMTREEAIRRAVRVSGADPVVCTTGKASRELYEIREANAQGHQYDFLTVGSMGHASSIALGIALQKPGTKVWCIDGDGAALMHMGAMAVIGTSGVKNLVHLLINNGAHESVGGMPNAAGKIDLAEVAKACGYPSSVCVRTAGELDRALEKAKGGNELSFIEVKCAIGAREDLGRPASGPRETRQSFTEYLQTLQ